MSDERFTLDELFAAARAAKAPPATVTRGWAALQVAIEGVAPTAAAGAAASSLGTLAKMAGIAAIAGAILVPVLGRSPDAPPREPIAAADAPVVATVEPSRTNTATPPVVTPTTTGVAPEATPASMPAARLRSARTIDEGAAARGAIERRDVPAPSASAPEPGEALRREAELLGRAWLAIRDRRSADTDALLAEHARRFPDGALLPERHACELVAACIARRPGAVAAARDHLAQHGGGHLAARVASGCRLARPDATSRDENTTRSAESDR